MKHIPIVLTSENIVADLHRRADLLRRLDGSNGYLIDADYLAAAADEIERLQQIARDPDLVIVQARQLNALCEWAGIPVIAEIEPQADPVYGHTFKWPEEMQQFLELRQLSKGDRHAL